MFINKTKNIILIILFLIIISMSVVTSIFWHEARNEIVFLCGNFVKGVSEKSVYKQLDTGDFLKYRTKKASSGSLVLVDSRYNLKRTTCQIELDSNGIVVFAIVK
jgi:hypothetical protein